MGKSQRERHCLMSTQAYREVDLLMIPSSSWKDTIPKEQPRPQTLESPESFSKSQLSSLYQNSWTTASTNSLQALCEQKTNLK